MMIGLEYILTAVTVLFLVGFIDLVATRQQSERQKARVKVQREKTDVFSAKTKK